MLWNLASLTSQSLNQFVGNLSRAEALSVEIASIYAGIRRLDGNQQMPQSVRVGKNPDSGNL